MSEPYSTLLKDRPDVGDPAKPRETDSPSSAYADRMADRLLDEADRLDWNSAEWSAKLALLAQAAGRQGDLDTYRWAQRERLDDPRAGCPNRILQDRDIHNGVEFRALDCGRRTCSWCGPLHVLARSDELHQALKALGGTAASVKLIFCTRDEATSRVRWLSRHARPAVAIPQPDGRAVVVALADIVPEAWPVLPVEELYPNLREALERLVEAVPVGESVRIRPNAMLLAAVREVQGIAQAGAEALDDLVTDADALTPWRPTTRAVVEYAIRHRLVVSWSSSTGIPACASWLPEGDQDHRVTLAGLRAFTSGRPLAVPA